jgi:hypothetical protein
LRIINTLPTLTPATETPPTAIGIIGFSAFSITFIIDFFGITSSTIFSPQVKQSLCLRPFSSLVASLSIIQSLSLCPNAFNVLVISS